MRIFGQQEKILENEHIAKNNSEDGSKNFQEDL